jgi:hypothetical protein
MEKRFQRKVEDFCCEKCGFLVKGNGYTNHCPKCLWGKHVDINPGDRAETCGGMMRPISVEKTKKGFDVIYRCEKCFKKRRSKSGAGDDFNVLVKISELASRLNQ